MTWTSAGPVWTSSEVMDEIFGIDREYQRTVPGWTELIPSSDRIQMAAYFAEEVVQGPSPSTRNTGSSGKQTTKERWVHGLGQLEFLMPEGQPLRMRGTVQDITERKDVL